MKTIMVLLLGFFLSQTLVAQKVQAVSTPPTLDELIHVSTQKWQWMADKNTDSIQVLFHDKSVFVHMGGSWGKQKELDVIKTGGIWYKKAEIHSTDVNIIGQTAILLSNITLLAEVGGNEVTNPFTVTEVYVLEDHLWHLASMSFTKLLTPSIQDKP
ncbi:MAG TPA: nuclear transport factor 2 family protein [Saprospiraceae bacterium]|nr:nuclear transport factor 2 family protein [Saprospiraceae bacterium]